MSRFSDYSHEMPRRRSIDDHAVEDLVAGRAREEDFGALVSFVRDARSAAAGPVPLATSAFVAGLTGGLSTDNLSTDNGDRYAPNLQGSESAGSKVHGSAVQASGLPKWRTTKMKVSRFLAGLPIVAKLLLGVTVAAAATTGAGAAGVLPGPVQDAVTTIAPFTGDEHPPTPPSGDTPPVTTVKPGPGAGPGGGSDAPHDTLPPTTTPAPTTKPPTGDPGHHEEPGHGSEPPVTTQPPPTTQPHHETGPPPTTQAPPTTQPHHDEPVHGTEPTSPPTSPPGDTQVAERAGLTCHAEGAETARHVDCSWPQGPNGTARYVLIRSTGDHGQVVFQTGDLAHPSFGDTSVVHGTAYGFMVLWLDANGHSLAHSNHVMITP